AAGHGASRAGPRRVPPALRDGPAGTESRRPRSVPAAYGADGIVPPEDQGPHVRRRLSADFSHSPLSAPARPALRSGAWTASRHLDPAVCRVFFFDCQLAVAAPDFAITARRTRPIFPRSVYASPALLTGVLR